MGVEEDGEDGEDGEEEEAEEEDGAHLRHMILTRKPTPGGLASGPGHLEVLQRDTRWEGEDAATVVLARATGARLAPPVRPLRRTQSKAPDSGLRGGAEVMKW